MSIESLIFFFHHLVSDTSIGIRQFQVGPHNPLLGRKHSLLKIFHIRARHRISRLLIKKEAAPSTVTISFISESINHVLYMIYPPLFILLILNLDAKTKKVMSRDPTWLSCVMTIK